jgi:hypothetical protein
MVREAARRPHRQFRQLSSVQVPVTAHDHVDLGCLRERHEVVVLGIARGALSLRRIGMNGRVALDASDELSRARLVKPPAEPWPQHHSAQLGDQLRAGDDLKPIIDSGAEDPIRRRAARTDQDGDENARIDDDPDHTLPRRSRRNAASSS